MERIRHFAENLPIEEPSVAEKIAEVEKGDGESGYEYDEEKNSNSTSVSAYNGYTLTEVGEHTTATATATAIAAKAKQAKKEEEIERIKREYTYMEEPPSDWPQGGTIEFQGVSMAYRKGPLVLKQLSCFIKVGIHIYPPYNHILPLSLLL